MHASVDIDMDGETPCKGLEPPLEAPPPAAMRRRGLMDMDVHVLKAAP